MKFSQWFNEQLQASADGFAWATEQVPEARRNVQPPGGLGEWSTIELSKNRVGRNAGCS